MNTNTQSQRRRPLVYLSRVCDYSSCWLRCSSEGMRLKQKLEKARLLKLKLIELREFVLLIALLIAVGTALSLNIRSLQIVNYSAEEIPSCNVKVCAMDFSVKRLAPGESSRIYLLIDRDSSYEISYSSPSCGREVFLLAGYFSVGAGNLFQPDLVKIFDRSLVFCDAFEETEFQISDL